MSSLLKNLLFGLGLAILLWLGYTLFINGDDDGTSNEEVINQANLEAQAFLAKLQSLRSIDIDGDIFNDPRFRSLQDFTVELEDEPTGRSNPFAPVN